jgi:hypothetical protein
MPWRKTPAETDLGETAELYDPDGLEVNLAKD